MVHRHPVNPVARAGEAGVCAGLWLLGGKAGCWPARIYNGQGEVVDLLPLQVAPLPGERDFYSDCYGLAADVWGDSREEVILFGSRGCCIYANARPLEQPSLYNTTLYPGM